MAIEDIKLHASPKDVYARTNKTEFNNDRKSVTTGTQTADLAPAKATDKAGAKDLAAAVDNVKELATGLNRNLQFSVDRDTGKTIVRIVDAENGEVVRQIPSEEFLALSKNLNELQGMLLHAQA